MAKKELLSAKQKRFCEEYVIDLNGTQAAIRAKYSEKTAVEQASRLLINVNIQDYIKVLQDKISERNGNLADMVIAEFKKIGFSNIQDFVNGGNSVHELKGLDKNKTAAVKGIKTKTNLNNGEATTELLFHDKVKALENLGKHLGLFKEDNEQQKTIPLPPVIKVYNTGPPLASSEDKIVD